MTAPLPPWANGPFELLVHAEGHLRGGEDFDRRIALISFDNAIEVAVATYLTLNPIQRHNRQYPKGEVEKWLDNYHTKLEFLEEEVCVRGESWLVEKAHIIFAHQHRNEQYHGGHKGTPEKFVLEIVRKAALWVFGLLFDVDDVEVVLARAMEERNSPPPPRRQRLFDVAIDSEYGVIQVGEQDYYASELLFSVDDVAYRDLGGRLCGDDEASRAEAEDES